MKNIKYYLTFLTVVLCLYSCSKSSNDQQIQVSSQEFHAGTYIQNGDTLNSKNKSNDLTKHQSFNYYYSSLVGKVLEPL